MKLPIPFLNKERQDSGVYYLALLLTHERVSAIILEEISGKIKLVKRYHHLFHKNIEDLELEELTDAIDKAVSRTEDTLPPGVDIHKTVFGVKQDWVENETKKIKKEYLQKLKKVCSSLDLTPIGFMVVNEAISHYMKEEEGAPLSAIFVELGHRTVTLTLFRGGQVVQTLPGPLTGSYAHTVDELLNKLTIEVLPARIILYDSKIDEDIVQQFITHHWSRSLPFLHMPQISVLPEGFDGQAVAFGAASQLGLEIFDKEALSTIKTYSPNHSEVKEKIHAEKPVQEIKETKETLEENNSFGFIKDQDIADQPEAHEGKGHSKRLENVSYETEDEPKFDHKVVSDSLTEPVMPDSHKHERKRHKSFLSKLSESFPKPKPISLPSFGKKGVLIPIVIAILLLGGIVGGVYYFYFNNVSANFIVTLSPKSGSQSDNVVFAADTESDFDKNIVAAKTVEGSLNGDMTIGATGKKDVGEKAKGKVTIYNNSTDGSTSLSSGSILKSDNGLSFTLDKDIKVASASGDVFSGTKPGTTDAEITADEIGSNYNMPSGTKFSVEGKNSLAAKNDEAFSGGSKKTVTVVSKDDLFKLRTDLIKKLEESASDELAKKTHSDEVILPVVLSTEVKTTKYDHEAGDESKTVKLTASVNFNGLSYKKSDLEEFAKSILAKKYSDDMTFDKNNVDAIVSDATKESDTEISADLVIDASLLPKIETDRLNKQLSGKSVKDAEEILSRLPQVEGTKIVYEPNISVLGKFIPSLPKNVTVTISSK